MLQAFFCYLYDTDLIHYENNQLCSQRGNQNIVTKMKFAYTS